MLLYSIMIMKLMVYICELYTLFVVQRWVPSLCVCAVTKVLTQLFLCYAGSTQWPSPFPTHTGS